MPEPPKTPDLAKATPSLSQPKKIPFRFSPGPLHDWGVMANCKFSR